MIQKPIEAAGDGNRMRVHYNDQTYYIIITEQSFEITFSSEDTSKIEDRTKVGLGLISALATALLQEKVDIEDLAAIMFTESLDIGDLADVLTKAIEAYQRGVP